MRITDNDLSMLIRAELRGMVDENGASLPDRFDAMLADAQRFRGIRMLLTEPDEAMQERMYSAVEQQMEAVEPPKPLTVEFINDLVDRLLLIAAGARNGGSNEA